MLTFGELGDLGRLARDEGQGGVAGFVDGRGGHADLFAGLDAVVRDRRHVDRRQLDTVDHQHAGVARSQVDESLSATAISAFDQRSNVPFTNLPTYARALASDDTLSVTVRCNGVAGACTNISRACACLNADASFTAQACGTVCTANGTTAGYYLTLDATTNFNSVIVPGQAVGNGQISRSITLRLE